MASVPRATLTPALEKASQEVYISWGDHTVTVDPMRRDPWIYDGDNQYHQGVRRGAEFDRIAYEQSLGWEKALQGRPSVFLPTSHMLDSALKYPIPQGQRCRGWRNYKRDEDRFGYLPVISQYLYENALQNKSVGDIEHEMRESDRRIAARLFDTSGYTR